MCETKENEIIECGHSFICGLLASMKNQYSFVDNIFVIDQFDESGEYIGYYQVRVRCADTCTLISTEVTQLLLFTVNHTIGYGIFTKNNTTPIVTKISDEDAKDLIQLVRLYGFTQNSDNFACENYKYEQQLINLIRKLDIDSISNFIPVKRAKDINCVN